MRSAVRGHAAQRSMQCELPAGDLSLNLESIYRHSRWGCLLCASGMCRAGYRCLVRVEANEALACKFRFPPFLSICVSSGAFMEHATHGLEIVRHDVWWPAL